MRVKHQTVRHSFRLAKDEEAVINQLAGCMSKRTPSPGMDAAFDYVGRVVARRRCGFACEWRQLASWTEQNWDRWLRKIETKAA